MTSMMMTRFEDRSEYPIMPKVTQRQAVSTERQSVASLVRENPALKAHLVAGKAGHHVVTLQSLTNIGLASHEARAVLALLDTAAQQQELKAAARASFQSMIVSVDTVDTLESLRRTLPKLAAHLRAAERGEQSVCMQSLAHVGLDPWQAAVVVASFGQQASNSAAISESVKQPSLSNACVLLPPAPMVRHTDKTPPLPASISIGTSSIADGICGKSKVAKYNFILADLRSNPSREANLEANLLDWVEREAPAAKSQAKGVADLIRQTYRSRSGSLDLWNWNNRNQAINHLPTHFLAQLPDSIGNLTYLKSLTLDCPNLTQLPTDIGNLTGLKNLRLNCDKLTDLPVSIGNLSRLEVLCLGRGLEFKHFPISIGSLTSLKDLSVSEFYRIKKLPAGIGNLSNLRTLWLRSCSNLIRLPANVFNLSSLERLEVTNCDQFFGGGSKGRSVAKLVLNLQFKLHRVGTAKNPDIVIL